MKHPNRVYNFSAGPAGIPTQVLTKIQHELLNWQQSGASVMELSHRGDLFKEIVLQSQQSLRELLNIPDNYHILFLHGGARSQFAMVPMNLIQAYDSAAYINTGVWSQLAIDEASLYTKVNVVANNESEQHNSIPKQDGSWKAFDDAAYLYYVDNETVNGIEFPYIPEAGDVPLVCDMASNILSRQFDINRYALIHACAQKNLGIAGVTLVIIRDDLLQRTPIATTPSMFRYENHVKTNSLYNTAPTFPWFVANEVLNWCKQQGGIAALEELTIKKSKKLYHYIDQSDFYTNDIEHQSRSRVNVVFKLTNNADEKAFLQQAEENGLIGLKGHRYVGGIRASLYNAMPESGVDALIDYMEQFY